VAEHLGPVGEADAWVFTADKGGVLRPSNFRVKVWLPAIRAAGLAPLRPQRPAAHGGGAVDRRRREPQGGQRPGWTHTPVAFTLDRYGHLFPGHDDELRDRLDAMRAQGLQAVPGGALIELPAAQARPGAAQCGPRQTKQTRRPGGIPSLTWADGGCAARDSNPEPLP
jgi:hypothetical protein